MPDTEKKLDFDQMARDYQEKAKCTWAQACLEIKRRYPEARAFWGAPPRAQDVSRR